LNRSRAPQARLARVCVVPALAVAAAAWGQQGGESPTTGANLPWADLDSQRRGKVEAEVARFLAPSKVDDRSANNLGWDCLAAVGLARAGRSGAGARLEAIAKALVAQAVIDPATKRARGWRATLTSARCTNGGYDAFGDGTCNAPDTTYAFQTGLAIACLAQASDVARRPEWRTPAGEAMDHWRERRLPGSVCDGCVTFAASDSAHDAGRYVRNMNLFMAFGAAQSGSIWGERSLVELARNAARADVAEREAGNRGYLGRLDPQWKARATERDRIENHSAAVAVLALEIGRTMSAGDALVQHAATVWRDWAGCDNDRCRTAGCGYWAGDARRCQATFTAAHCAFRPVDPRAAEQCRIYLDQARRLPSFAIWALILGGVATR
jgi:hypothetical protein